MWKHGFEGTRLYKIWDDMKQRCGNPKASYFKCYGGRGISVCEEWVDFRGFLEWSLANGYNDIMTIERNDVNGNYCPENCRWIPKAEQQRNRRNNHFLTFNGEAKTIAEWGDITGISASTIHHRVCRDGWSIERALNTPTRKYKRRMRND